MYDMSVDGNTIVKNDLDLLYTAILLLRMISIYCIRDTIVENDLDLLFITVR